MIPYWKQVPMIAFPFVSAKTFNKSKKEGKEEQSSSEEKLCKPIV